MPQPPDYEEQRYSYPEERSTSDRVLKWVAGIVGSLIVVFAGFGVSCTSAKMDAMLDKQNELGRDVGDLRGDVKVVTTKLEAQDKQYDRDRDETNRRLNAVERRP